MGGTALRVILAGLVETQLAIDGEANFSGVFVFLAVIFPPADRTQHQSGGRIEGSVAAARTTIPSFDRGTHTRMDGKKQRGDYVAARNGDFRLFPISRRLHKESIREKDEHRPKLYLYGALRGVYPEPGDVGEFEPYTLPLESTQ